jgi:glycosyltransferase involved in cell wall biosynthesis
MYRESGIQAMVVVVIPCYKVTRHILAVLSAIGPEVQRILVVDDACPDGSGKLVASDNQDPRVEVIYHEVNLGVGGAMKTGYRRAYNLGAEVIVKIDGDGQMDPALISLFTSPILRGEADYTKGNRFYEMDVVSRMPRVRLFGNIGLSFLTKLSSGYWNLFDPTNGYTAISGKIIPLLQLDKIEDRYFFESDLIFRLNTLRAVVIDIPMDAIYGDEKSNLQARAAIRPFLVNNLRNFGKRIFYNYFCRDFNYASLELIIGIFLAGFGFMFGSIKWLLNAMEGTVASAGTVMLSGLTLIIGVQMLLGFLQYDMSNLPKNPLQNRLARNLEMPNSSSS